MNYFRVEGALVAGLQAIGVRVECAQARRLPYLQILGGSAGSSGELRERVIAALGTLAGGKFRLPARRFTVQIHPEARGGPLESLDLAVAVALLGSCGHFPASRTDNLLICGRLGLDGSLSMPTGESALRRLLRERTYDSALLPWRESAALEERQLARGGGFLNLAEVLEFLRGTGAGRRAREESERMAPSPGRIWDKIQDFTLGRRVIEIAAAGSHHVLLSGSAPGARAALLAHALSALLPPLAAREAEEVREIYALAGIPVPPSRPFHAFGTRAGLPPLLGERLAAGVEEALLAHRGVLYIDQACEREPALFPALLPLLGTGTLPARFLRRSFDVPAEAIVVASTPSCGCGGRGDPALHCTCRPTEARRYQARWKKLLRYPFDLCVPLLPDRAPAEAAETAETVAARVALARDRMQVRGKGWNARLGEEALWASLPWSPRARKLWSMVESRSEGRQETALASARVALTLCDLRGGEEVGEGDLLEALHYSPAGEGAGPVGRSGRASAPAVNSTAIPNVRSP